MAAPEFDLRLFPLVLIHVPPFVDVDELPEFYDALVRLSLDHGKHVAIFDFRDFDPVFAPGPIRRAAANLVRERLPVFEKNVVAEAHVIEHALTRAMTSAFRWLVTVPWPVNAVATPAAADRWIRAEAARVGMAIPEGAVDLDELRRRAV